MRPHIINRSTVLVEATAVTRIVTLERTPVLLAEDTVLVGPAHFLGLLGDPGVDGLPLALPFSPFRAGSLGIEIALFSMFSSTSSSALVLTGVVFSERSYWACHLAGHIRNR